MSLTPVITCCHHNNYLKHYFYLYLMHFPVIYILFLLLLCISFITTWGHRVGSKLVHIIIEIFAIWSKCPPNSRNTASIPKISTNLSRDVIFPTMWYARPAKAQTSLRIRAYTIFFLFVLNFDKTKDDDCSVQTVPLAADCFWSALLALAFLSDYYSGVRNYKALPQKPKIVEKQSAKFDG